MRKALSVLLGVVLAIAFIPVVRAADAKPDDEGFIKDWLLLAPIPLGDGISGADEIDKKQIADEGGLKPKAGDKQKVLDKDVEWKAISAKAFDIDINDQLKGSHEDVLAYLVTYVVADKEMPGLTILCSSNDQGKLYLNGKEIHKYAEGGTVDKDRDKVENVTLKKGVNVIVYKVINEKNNWGACLRFVDKANKPVTNLVVKTAP
jgi:hypothetical protein